METKHTLIGTLRRADDLELHVRRTDVTFVEGELLELISVREYVPSTKWYGRGVTFPLGDLGAVRKLLDKAEEGS